MTCLEQEYERHYNEFVECDFCGQATRGRVYPERPIAVHCGACNRIIVNRPMRESDE